MSGIIGSKLNHRGSGLVGSAGTDGQHLLSSGPGKTNVFESVASADLTPVRHDVLLLALKQAIQENSSKFNLANSSICKFEADADFNLAGSTTTKRHTDEYIYAGSTGTAQVFNTLKIESLYTNTAAGAGGWSGSHAQDEAINTPGNHYWLNNIDYLFDLAAGDFEVRIFNVNSSGTPVTQSATSAHYCITTDTSVAAGHNPAIFRTPWETNNSTYHNQNISTTIWGDEYITDAYNTTIGGDAFASSMMLTGGTSGIMTVDAADTNAWVQRYYDNGLPYGGIATFDRSEDRLTWERPLNSPASNGWDSPTLAADNISGRVIINNIPATGRMMIGCSMPGATDTDGHATTFAGADSNDCGYVYESADVINATGTALGTTNVPTSAVTEVSGVLLLKNEAGTATLGTDVKVYFTADNSAFTEAASYADAGTFSTGIKMIKLGKTTVTSGSDVRWKIVWANQADGSKESYIYGIGLNY